MSLTKWAGFACGAASLTLTSVGHAGDIAADNVDAKISALESEVARLKAQQGADWLTEERAEQVRGLVNDVLADADTRASLLQSGMSAGYDKGFYLGSSDGNWSMTMNGWLQSRFVYNDQDDSADDSQWGFENTRTKLIFTGNVVDPTWTYRIESNFARDGGSLDLDEAWIRWDYGDGWGVRFGQFRLPVTRENMIYGVHQLAVERSNVDYIFSPGFAQGVMVEYNADQLRFRAAYSDGYGGTRNGFANTAWSTQTTEYAFTGRLEYMAMGNWDQFADFTSPAGDETGLLLGISGHIEDGAYGTAAPETGYSLFSVDAQAEFGGANAFAAFVYRNVDIDGGDDMDQYGFVIQGGLAFNEDWEGFLRYEWTDFDSAAEDLSLITFGVNRYFAGHNLKWTTDVVIGINEIEAGAVDITGTQTDAAGEDGQIAIRTQLQLLF